MQPAAQRIWVIAGAVAALGLAGLGGAVGFNYFAPSHPAEIDPNQIREQLRDPTLTDEDRRALRDKLREQREREMNARVDEYFTANDDTAKQAVLDRHIDEWQKQLQEWEARRKAEEAQRANKENNDKNQKKPDFNSMTNQQKKERSESGNPDQRAKMMAYFEALRARMSERGIQSPGRGPAGNRGGGNRGGAGAP